MQKQYFSSLAGSQEEPKRLKKTLDALEELQDLKNKSSKHEPFFIRGSSFGSDLGPNMDLTIDKTMTQNETTTSNKNFTCEGEGVRKVLKGWDLGSSLNVISEIKGWDVRNTRKGHVG